MESLTARPRTLHEAASAGDVGACYEMLKNGADVDLRNEVYRCPIFEKNGGVPAGRREGPMVSP
jgi:hypothetical protein